MMLENSPANIHYVLIACPSPYLLTSVHRSVSTPRMKSLDTQNPPLTLIEKVELLHVPPQLSKHCIQKGSPVLSSRPTGGTSLELRFLAANVSAPDMCGVAIHLSYVFYIDSEWLQILGKFVFDYLNLLMKFLLRLHLHL